MRKRSAYNALLEELLLVSGINTVCQHCWKGETFISPCCEQEGDRDMAAACKNLGPTGCIGKPTACAAWTCTMLRTDKKWPKGFAKFLQRLYNTHPVYSYGDAVVLYKIESVESLGRFAQEKQIPKRVLRRWIRRWKRRGPTNIQRFLNLPEARR